MCMYNDRLHTWFSIYEYIDHKYPKMDVLIILKVLLPHPFHKHPDQDFVANCNTGWRKFYRLMHNITHKLKTASDVHVMKCLVSMGTLRPTVGLLTRPCYNLQYVTHCPTVLVLYFLVKSSCQKPCTLNHELV